MRHFKSIIELESKKNLVENVKFEYCLAKYDPY